MEKFNVGDLVYSRYHKELGVISSFLDSAVGSKFAKIAWLNNFKIYEYYDMRDISVMVKHLEELKK